MEQSYEYTFHRKEKGMNKTFHNTYNLFNSNKNLSEMPFTHIRLLRS